MTEEKQTSPALSPATVRGGVGEKNAGQREVRAMLRVARILHAATIARL